MIRIQEAILVEGRYDKNTLSQLVDTLILQTDGFAIFRNEEKRALLRRLAEARGLIILTDSDSAGFVIRNHLRGVLPTTGVRHAYIPMIAGREARKKSTSREGLLGVEGMSPDALLKALRQAGAAFLDEKDVPSSIRTPVSKADLFAWELCGQKDSAIRRAELCRRLDLPTLMGTNALLTVLNTLYSKEEIETMAQTLQVML